jgi:glycosyltransferase involved in cell wall biosynthesis
MQVVEDAARTPAVSVVIPTRDRPRQLARAVQSALAQSAADLEILVVDDASTTPAAEGLAAFGDVRLRVLRHAQRRGASAARNTGIAHARGAFVALLDDDDEWLPAKLERQLTRFATGGEDLGLVYCGVEVVAEASGTIERRDLPEGAPVVYADLLRSTFFGASAAMVRRACFDTVGGFDDDLSGAQDRDMWLRLAKRYRFDYVPDALVRWYIHGDQITTNLTAKIDARQRLLRKYGDDLQRHPVALAKHLLSLGMMYGADARPAPAAWCFLRAIRRCPRDPVAYRHLARLLASRSGYRTWVHAAGFRRIDGISLYY